MDEIPDITITYDIYGTELATERVRVTITEPGEGSASSDLFNGGVPHEAFRDALKVLLFDLELNGPINPSEVPA